MKFLFLVPLAIKIPNPRYYFFIFDRVASSMSCIVVCVRSEKVSSTINNSIQDSKEHSIVLGREAFETAIVRKERAFDSQMMTLFFNYVIMCVCVSSVCVCVCVPFT